MGATWSPGTGRSTISPLKHNGDAGGWNSDASERKDERSTNSDGPCGTQKEPSANDAPMLQYNVVVFDQHDGEGVVGARQCSRDNSDTTTLQCRVKVIARVNLLPHGGMAGGLFLEGFGYSSKAWREAQGGYVRVIRRGKNCGGIRVQ